MTALLDPTSLPHAQEERIQVRAPIRLLVVDDHPAMLRGLQELFESQPDFQVAAVASSAGEGMAAAGRQRFDVAIVDYRLRDRNGLWLSRKLNRLSNAPAVLVYSAQADGMLAAAAVAARAHGLVGKGDDEAKLCEAVRIVAGGGLVLPVVPWQVSEVIRRRLDDQEQAIYGMLLAGFAGTEIEAMMDLSEAELEARLEAMLRKLEPAGSGPYSPD